MRLRAALEDPVDQSRDQRDAAEGRGDQQRRAPARGVGIPRPHRRQVRGIGTGPRDAQIEAEREPELLALEPLSEGRGHRHDHGLGAEAEHEASRSHPDERAGKPGDDRAGEADRREDQRRRPGADTIDDHPADEHHDDVRQAVDRVERADLRRGEPELILQDVRQRRDGVVGVVVAEHGQADEHQHAPADGGGRRGLVRNGVGHGGSLQPIARRRVRARPARRWTGAGEDS